MSSHNMGLISPERPITREEALTAAAHWRHIAAEEDASADFQEAHGLPHGDVSTFRSRARLWREVAADIESHYGVQP